MRRYGEKKQWGDDPFAPLEQASLGAYMRRGGRFGVGITIGLESVFAAFFIMTRLSLLLLGIEGLDEILGCFTLIIGGICAAIGYGIGSLAGLLAWHARGNT